MTRKSLVVVAMLVCVISLFASAAIVSASSHTLQVEATSCVVTSQWLPVGDEAGHVVGVQQREGEAVFSNGETAKYYTVSTFDAKRGKEAGSSQGYSKFVFADDSFIMFSWKSDITRDETGLSHNKGQGNIISGSGRFNGITGISEFSGRQLKPTSEDPKGITLQNAIITFELP